MKKLIFSLVAVIIFMLGFMVANVIGFKNIAEAAGEIWKRIDLNVFNQDLITKVGIGTKTPSEKLSVAGKIESTDGGFKFPDGTVQATAGDKNLHLYDANGQDLGVYTGRDNYITSWNDNLKEELQVSEAQPSYNKDGSVYKNGSVTFWPKNFSNISFENSDCSGKAFLFWDNFNTPKTVYKNTIFPTDPNNVNGSEWYGTIDQNLSTSTRNSMFETSGFGVCQKISPETSWATQELRKVNLPFTLPLAYPLSIK